MLLLCAAWQVRELTRLPVGRVRVCCLGALPGGQRFPQRLASDNNMNAFISQGHIGVCGQQGVLASTGWVGEDWRQWLMITDKRVGERGTLLQDQSMGHMECYFFIGQDAPWHLVRERIYLM